MRNHLETAIRTQLLAVAEDRDLDITTGDVAALTDAAVTAAYAPSLLAGPTELTNQQTGVLVGLALGDSVKVTARRMCLSVHTVKTHRRQLYKALGARTAPEAVAIAMSLGLLRLQRPLAVPGQRDGSAA
ncbi:LuxR family transcriptional regulator [Streptomyces sp. A0642]|uniref:response regulator transcription factor n=1 Tax=Streptomyces sp. A0642 TaxID=2563100 RepID=UPI0010A20ACB|nr:helix-turn-helix transcriptional regulator [Streptomyces sp. A0642]THA78383.1 LuxR family transcriptional regulator [Streptomyces sp. A0642]